MQQHIWQIPRQKRSAVLCGALLLLTLLSVHCHPARQRPCQTNSTPLLVTTLETDPTVQGWIGKQLNAHRTTDAPFGGTYAMQIIKGEWLSPAFPVTPFAFYEIRFASQAERKGYWTMHFYDANGKELIADNFSSVDASATWQENTFCVMARSNAVTARLAFQPIRAPLRIDNISVRSTTACDVLAWSNALYKTLPPITCSFAPDRFRHLPNTLTHLQSGKELTVVALGDSIINDLASAPFQLLIERHYPRARIRLIHALRGGTGCWYYRDKNRVQPYVLDHQPDLVIIGGISHRYDAGAVLDVIRQIRAKQPGVEILVMSGAICPLRRKAPAGATTSPAPPVPLPGKPGIYANEHDYFTALCAKAEEERFATLDMRKCWANYLADSPQPLAWYQRDEVHANDRGKQILARILEQFFQP